MRIDLKDNVIIMNSLYELILDNLEVGVHVINQSEVTVIYNKQMGKIESMKPSDVIGNKILDVFTFHENDHSTLRETLKSGKASKNIRQTYFNNKGQEITTINNTFLLKLKGKTTMAIEIAKDITQLEHVIKENVIKKKNQYYSFDQIIGTSPNFMSVVDEAKRSTRTTSSVLIVGETGTGKELFAQSIHNGSSRSEGPFIAQNCAAIPESLMESILFGTKKGAFTDATNTPGLFEQANGGTLLLDEINSLDISLQTKLLRVIQEKTVRPIGGTNEKKVDVRIIATMNENPEEVIGQNLIRKDLYYRLSVVHLHVPPLRERKSDILTLVNIFIKKYNKLFHMYVNSVENPVVDIFHKYDWPGNVRELENVIEGAMNLIIDDDEIKIIHLPERIRNAYWVNTDTSEREIIRENAIKQEKRTKIDDFKNKKEHIERDYIKESLKKHNFNITRTAKSMGLSRQSLQYRLKKYKINKKTL